jgi:hypothetical protein
MAGKERIVARRVMPGETPFKKRGFYCSDQEYKKLVEEICTLPDGTRITVSLAIRKIIANWDKSKMSVLGKKGSRSPASGASV